MLQIENSTLEEVCILAGENPSECEALLELVRDIKDSGTGSYNGTEYIYRRAHNGMEIVSMQEFLAEKE